MTRTLASTLSSALRKQPGARGTGGCQAVAPTHRTLIRRKKDGILPFAAAWVDLEGVAEGDKVRQTNARWFHSEVESKE